MDQKWKRMSNIELSSNLKKDDLSPILWLTWHIILQEAGEREQSGTGSLCS